MENSEPVPNLVRTEEDFIQIECGYHHSAAVTKEGEIMAWGRGVFGQLGLGSNQSYSSPQPIEFLGSQIITSIACGWQHTMALTQTGQVFSWGYGEDGQLGHGNINDSLIPKLIESIADRNVSQIAWGHSHSGVIAQGEVYMWGSNPDARLMIEKSDNISQPTTTLMSQLREEDPEMFTAKHLSLGVTHSAVSFRLIYHFNRS